MHRSALRAALKASRPCLLPLNAQIGARPRLAFRIFSTQGPASLGEVTAAAKTGAEHVTAAAKTGAEHVGKMFRAVVGALGVGGLGGFIYLVVNSNEARDLYILRALQDMVGVMDLKNSWSSYSVVVGEHGVGKTTLADKAVAFLNAQGGKSRKKGGVLFLSGELANSNATSATVFTELCRNSVWLSIVGFFGGSQVTFDDLLMHLSSVARKYQAKHGQCAVLVVDDVTKLSDKQLAYIQDQAKVWADNRVMHVVFLLSGGTVSRKLAARSSWSRAMVTLHVGDMTKDESLQLMERLGVASAGDREWLFQHVTGGRPFLIQTLAQQFALSGDRKTVADAAHMLGQRCVAGMSDEHDLEMLNLAKKLLQQPADKRNLTEAEAKALVGKNTLEALHDMNLVSISRRGEPAVVTFESRPVEAYYAKQHGIEVTDQLIPSVRERLGTVGDQDAMPRLAKRLLQEPAEHRELSADEAMELVGEDNVKALVRAGLLAGFPPGSPTKLAFESRLVEAYYAKQHGIEVTDRLSSGVLDGLLRFLRLR